MDSMSNDGHLLSNARLFLVATIILVCATFWLSPLYIGSLYGVSFHFASVWFSALAWVMLAVAASCSWIRYLYLKSVDSSDKKGLFWAKFGASMAILGLFALYVLVRGSMDYYFDTVLTGKDRIHQLEKTVELGENRKLVLYWCIEPALSPCILILAVQEQLPLGIIMEQNLHHKEGSTDCTLTLDGNTAKLTYDSKSFSFPLENFKRVSISSGHHSFAKIIEDCIVKGEEVYNYGNVWPLLPACGATPLYHRFYGSQGWNQIGSKDHYDGGPVGFCIEPITDKEAIVMGGYLPGEGSPDYDARQTWIWNQSSDTVKQGPAMCEARWMSASRMLDSGEILITGGYNGSELLVTCELLDNKRKKFRRTTNLCAARDRHAIFPINTTNIVVFGGEGTKEYAHEVELLELGKASRVLGTLSIDRRDPRIAASGTNKFLVCGGNNSDTSNELPGEEFTVQLGHK